ncbi:MAG: hypothetical protein H8E38_05520 [SAR324 cluster bacterium]|nr:hypothetical protein [SAR324 cluster bacterium]MBL7034163.1 hypothetical protein [SAR324 cluster bacterium]
MEDKSTLLKEMRKHAQSFSAAMTPPKVVDVANLKHALALVDMTTKDSILGAFRKMSLKIPPLLLGLRLVNNMSNLRTEINTINPQSQLVGASLTEEQRKKEFKKIKLAEQRLRKLLDIKSC